MLTYESIRRRWTTALSPARSSGTASIAEPSGRWTAHGAPEWIGDHLGPSALRMRSGAARIARSYEALPPAAVPVTRPVLGEEVFRSVLQRERRRAERFSEPFVLLLLGTSDPDASAVSWSEIVRIVQAATRETDVVGWVTTGSVLGVVMTELTENDEPVAREAESRVRQDLRRRLPARALEGLSTTLHFNVRSRKAPSETLWPDDPLLSGIDAPGAVARANDSWKRPLDVLGAAALLILLWPMLLAIAALIKLMSPGPVLFRQTRLGRNAHPFTMLKFRTMYVDADQDLHREFVTKYIRSSGQKAQPASSEALFKMVDDPRVTPLGRLLRKSSLDELPQLWNVLRGDMSLVGPRPLIRYEAEEYRPWHWRRVLEAKPGLTGLWQVSGRSRTTFDEMVRLDLRYVRSRSLWTDIKILLATPWAVLTGRGAC